jgi:hypothetical protein
MRRHVSLAALYAVFFCCTVHPSLPCEESILPAIRKRRLRYIKSISAACSDRLIDNAGDRLADQTSKLVALRKNILVRTPGVVRLGVVIPPHLAKGVAQYLASIIAGFDSAKHVAIRFLNGFGSHHTVLQCMWDRERLPAVLLIPALQ